MFARYTKIGPLHRRHRSSLGSRSRGIHPRTKIITIFFQNGLLNLSLVFFSPQMLTRSKPPLLTSRVHYLAFAWPSKFCAPSKLKQRGMCLSCSHLVRS